MYAAAGGALQIFPLRQAMHSPTATVVNADAAAKYERQHSDKKNAGDQRRSGVSEVHHVETQAEKTKGQSHDEHKWKEPDKVRRRNFYTVFPKKGKCGWQVTSFSYTGPAKQVQRNFFLSIKFIHTYFFVYLHYLLGKNKKPRSMQPGRKQ